MSVPGVIKQQEALPPDIDARTSSMPTSPKTSHATHRREATSHRAIAGLAGNDTQSRLMTLWQETEPELLRLAAALGAGRSLQRVSASDVLQDVYLQATKLECEQFTNQDLRRWLFRVTVNRCKWEGRKQSRWRRVWQTLTGKSPGNGKAVAAQRDPPTNIQPAETSTPDDAASIAIRKEQRELIHKVLDEMPSNLRAVLVLRYFHDQNSREIAAVMETSDSTIRSRLRTARRMLAAALNTLGIHN